MTTPIMRWRVGSVEIARIVELGDCVFEPADMFPGLTRDDVTALPWLFPNFATRDGRLKISYQAFAIRCGDLRIVVDTCLGADRDCFIPEYSQLSSSFVEDLTRAGFAPETVDRVVCTHLHFDHVGWNVRLVNERWEPTFPNARYLFARREFEHVTADRIAPGGYDYRHLAQSVDPIVEAGLADLVRADHRITDEVALMPTPGHTPGHVSVHVASEGEEAVITGDMIHHPIQVARPRQRIKYDRDADAGSSTRARFVERCTDSNVRVIGSHFARSTAGWVRSHGSERRFVEDITHSADGGRT